MHISSSSGCVRTCALILSSDFCTPAALLVVAAIYVVCVLVKGGVEGGLGVLL